MEAWAIVTLVLGSNAIVLLGNWLLIKKELKHSDEQLEKRLEVQREADKHERQREVRDEPLVKLRDELASMAEKLETSIDLATQLTDEVNPDTDKMIREVNKAVEKWDAYITSGVFYQTLHMQFNHDLKVEAHKIFLDYQSAFMDVRESWNRGKVNEVVDKARVAIKENAAKVSEVQLEIIKLREGL